jgi:hypothetical protein
MSCQVISIESIRQTYSEMQESSSSTTGVMDEILADPSFKDNIKSLVEGKVAEIIMQILTSHSGTIIDDPFDPIYLYDLLPDNIQANMNLSAYSNLQDVSDEVEFNDDWD